MEEKRGSRREKSGVRLGGKKDRVVLPLFQTLILVNS